MDALLKKFFESDRWNAAIRAGREKGISRDELHEMCTPEFRKALLCQLLNGTYTPVPPHTAKIPKDEPGKFRTVFVNEAKDRVIFSMMNSLFVDECRNLIHPHCTSYLPGIGTGKVVMRISDVLQNMHGVCGFKADLTKYFDSVPLWAIDEVYNRMPRSVVVNAARGYSHSRWCFSKKNRLVERYQSLKQGCAVASFLADALLYDLDEKLTKMAKSVGGCYYRYSDDLLYLGANHREAKAVLEKGLAHYELTLNPKKVQLVRSDQWVKFLGWNLKGEWRTLSASRIAKFKKGVYKATIGNRKKNFLRNVVWFLYGGEYSWATSVLPIMNVEEDVKALDEFVKDCIRCRQIGRCKPKDVGGIGSSMSLKTGTVSRGTGHAVTAARERTPKMIDGYMSLVAAQKAMQFDRATYDTLVRGLL